jgi:hypothetical protein
MEPCAAQMAFIVNNNKMRPTTNNRGYGRPLTKAPGRVCVLPGAIREFQFP